LKAVHRTSITRIAQNCGVSTKQVLSYLQKLKIKGDIMEMNPTREILCNSCGSVNTSTIFSCPKCMSFNFVQTKLIEHFDCGNFSTDSTYEDDKCPKCKKQIKALGVDYRVMTNVFICKDCSEKFPNPDIDLNCIKCGNKFTFFEGKWIDSPTFMWMKQPLEKINHEPIIIKK